ncbi:hypothetical protein [Streptomyces violascens]|uniref:hypothetical protein n=1 Tax=Streptomyces violascens TaxID=67381 RepID=UPI0036B876EF
MAQYEASVFPASPDGVTAEERAARRTYAYRVAAEDALPENIRRLAARVLAALDEGDHGRARDAIRELSQAVRKQERTEAVAAGLTVSGFRPCYADRA